MLEIEKVNELCKDFCIRYQARLKTTMQNEQLVHVDMDEDCDMDSLPSSSSTPTSYQVQGQGGQTFSLAPATIQPQMVAQVY